MISETDVKQVFAGDGTANVRNTSIKVFEADDLIIYKLTDAEPPVETLLEDGVDYTLVLGSPLPAGVAITPLAVIPGNIIWIAYRASDFTQDTDWVNAETFPSAAHEIAADRAVMLTQDLDFYRTRALRISPLDTDSDMVLPRIDDRKGKIMQFNLTTGVLDLVTSETLVFDFTTLGTNIVESDTGAEVRALVNSQEDVITAEGDVIIGDSSNDPSILVKGTSGDVLTAGASTLSWETPRASVISEEGDLITGDSSSDPIKLTKGTDGDVLTAGASTVAWVTPPITTEGDIIVGDVNGDPVRLPQGLEGEVLAVGADTLEFVPVEGTSITTKGDLITGDINGDPARLEKGTEGEVLVVGADTLSWEAAAEIVIQARGDLAIGDSAGDPIALTKGTADQVLTSDGTDLSWETPRASVISAEGDIIIGDSSNDPIKLTIGTSGDVLTAGANTVSWSAPVSIEQDTFANRPAASTADNLFIATDQKLLYRDNGTIWQALNALPPQYGEGFYISKTGDDQLTVSPGVCQSINVTAGETVRLELTVPLAKEIDLAYTPGDGGGGKSGLHTYDPNSFYSVFVVGKDDGTTVMGIDGQSASANGLRLRVSQQEGGTWNHYRQIAWVHTDTSNNIDDFLQVDNTILYQSPTIEETDSLLKTPTNWAAGLAITLKRCPPNVFGIFRGIITDIDNDDGFRLAPMYENNVDVDSGPPVDALSSPPNMFSYSNNIAVFELEIWVDVNQQIRGRHEAGDNDSNLELNTIGFRYDRFRIP